MTGKLTPKPEPFWLLESKDLYRDLYIELDVIMKGIDRFFNPDNLPTDTESLSEKNFHHELIIVRDSILRMLAILEVVLPESKKNAYWFTKFAENKFYSDYKRDFVIQNDLSPDDPEKGMFLLYDSFINFKSIVVDIVKTKKINFLSFKNLGDLLRREMRENEYFNPFKQKINSEYDRIENHQIKAIVTGIKNKKLKRSISMSFILLFRLLRYLNCVDLTTKRNISISCGLLILILIHSEVKELIHYFDREMKKEYTAKIKHILQGLSFQLSIEIKRVYYQELKNIFKQKTIRNIRGKIENSHGILKNLVEQSTVQIAEHFNPDIKGDDVFSTFITKMAQSTKLREDIYILFQLLTMFEKNLVKKDKRSSVFESLRNYMLYMESFTFKLLRYDDYEEFNRFFSDFLSRVKMSQLTSFDIKNTTDLVHNFIIYLETTINHISNRVELQGIPIDTDRTDYLLKQYLQ